MPNLSLSVRIDPNSGFCFGVIYAIQMAEDLLDEQGYLYCLGDIVHNDEEVQRLEARGLRIICHEQLAELRDEAVLIRAHGEPPATYQMALENNLTLIDASCPVVLKLQNRIKTSYDKQEKIFIYGKHGHAEVLGLLGQTSGNAVVFESLDELLTPRAAREHHPLQPDHQEHQQLLQHQEPAGNPGLPGECQRHHLPAGEQPRQGPAPLRRPVRPDCVRVGHQKLQRQGALPGVPGNQPANALHFQRGRNRLRSGSSRASRWASAGPPAPPCG